MHRLTIAAVAACLLSAGMLFAAVDTAWVRRYDGPEHGADLGKAIAVDAAGNMYVTGQSIGAGTGDDYATIKYDSAGVEQWVARYCGPESLPGNTADQALAIAVDTGGNVYVTGKSRGVSTGLYDYATVRYNPAGVEQWARRYNGPGNDADHGKAIALDPAGNVYVTGQSVGAGGVLDDYATIKYTPAGVEQWVRRYNGPQNGYDRAYALAVDAAGNVYVTGYANESQLTGNDYVTIKYDTDGVEKWIARYNGPMNEADHALAIALGPSCVYVTGQSNGTSYDFVTARYNSSTGAERWTRRYGGAGWDRAQSIAVDAAGNAYVTGYWNDADYATVKYDSAGTEQWARRYDGPGAGIDKSNSIALGPAGNVYVTGQSAGAGTGDDYATLDYDAAGTQRWVARYCGPVTPPGSTADQAWAIAADTLGNVYVTGQSFGDGTDFDYATIKYVQTTAVGESRGFPASRRPRTATIVQGNLLLPTDDRQRAGCGTMLLDAAGREAARLSPGTNDISRLAPGIYFFRESATFCIRKVIIQ